MTVTLRPSDLQDMWWKGYRPRGSLAVDTETSGLYADDGARISTVSAAWEDPEAKWLDLDYENLTWKTEEYAPGQFANIVSIAWPFDQGVAGKPEDRGQEMLFPEAENLSLDEWNALLGWLTNSEGLDFHNAKFDIEKFRVGVRRWPGVGVDLLRKMVWDTQNVNHLLWPLERTSLKPTAARLFGQEYADESDKVKKHLRKAKLPSGRWDLMPWDIIGTYADMDSRLTKMLKLRQIWEIEHNDAGSWLWKAIAEEVRAEGRKDPIAVIKQRDVVAVYEKVLRRLDVTRVLYRMEKRGLPYDEVESRLAAEECHNRAKEVADPLPFNPTDVQAKRFFFDDGVTQRGVPCLNMVPYSVTDKGSPQLTGEILERMVEDHIPHADDWLKYKKVANAASMWYEAYADAIGADGRLRTCFRQNGTVSSRFSVERVNLQAIPQNYRLSSYEILNGIPTPRELIAMAVEKMMPGWGIWELDLAQAELRVAAMFARCESMLEMIRNGDDLHTFTTKALFPHVHENDPLFKDKWRQVGKRANFSLGFNAQGPTFARMVSKESGIRLKPHEATNIVIQWNRLYPEFARANDSHSRKVAARQARHKRGWIDFINGERRWFDRFEETGKSFNQRVQGNLAQFGIDWMLRTDEFLRGEGMDTTDIGGAGLVLTIHDSQVLLLPKDERGEALAAECAQFGKDLWAEWFPGVPGDVDYKAW